MSNPSLALTMGEPAGIGGELTLKASYAMSYRRGGSQSFQVGESIVGQCALERKMFILN